jgi:hypothetical protein
MDFLAEEVDDIYESILDYEEQNGLFDPDEDVDVNEDTEAPVVSSEGKSSNIPPIPEGKSVTPLMLNFVQNVTKSYRICFFQFINFVDNAHSLSPDILGYCTRENIDTFFLEVISKRTTNPAVNRRYVSAIQKYCIFWEERTGFIVENDVVKKALADAKLCKKKFHSRFSEHVDAHKHRPTRHPSPAQELSMIELAFKDHRSSKYGWLPLGVNFLISWNCAMQGFTRGDEVRNCRLPDLCHEVNFGPWRLSDQGLSNISDQSSPDGILSIIQQPFNTKIMSSKAHAVGFFRHKDWRRCATSIISFSLMARFEYMNHSQLDNLFSFDEKKVPNWYKCYLIDWRKYNNMADVFKEYFATAGIEYTKLTHARKLGIIRAHQLGADRENIILLSKHTTHKVDTSYLPELPYNAMLACAGFDVFRRQEYYIPRSYAKVPLEWHSLIFPYLHHWKEQVNELHFYDKGSSARNFVNHVLPHAAQVIIQDGIYLISSYPDHPYSKILLNKLHNAGYIQWATEMRAMIDNRESIIHQNIVEDRRYDAMLRTTEHTAHKVLSVEHRIDSLTTEVRKLTNVLLESQQRQHNNHVPQVIESPIYHVNNMIHLNAVTPLELDSYAFRMENELPAVNLEQRQQLTANHTPTRHSTNMRSVPIIPPNVHKSIKENMEYWLYHKLWNFLSRKDVSLRQLGWDSKIQHRFCRRRDIALWVKTVAEEVFETELRWESDGDVLLNVASIMDEERGKKTVVAALDEFKKNSQLSWKKCRVKKTT